MKVSVLYEEKNKEKTYLNVLDSLESVLEERGTESIKIGLSGGSIKKCRGCFGCWVKTPGECVIGDGGNDIAREVINSDICIILATVRYGSYSSVSKQALDRFIPLISPFFRFIDGEVHHRKRYDKYPDFLPIGVMQSYDGEQERLFKKIGMRNKINFFSGDREVIVISGRDTPGEINRKIKDSIR